MAAAGYYGLSGSKADGGYYASGGKKPATRKRDPEPSGFGGFFQNLGSDLRDLTGIPAGIVALGRAAVHDAGKAIGLADGEYQLDNIGGAIKDDYYRTYVKPFRQHDGVDAWKALGRNIYRNPLAPALDVGAAFTGGGALAGKLATKVATTTGSTRAAKIAGLQRVDEITPSTIRPASGPAGKYAAATRPIIDPATKKVLYERPVVRNPVIRARKDLVEKAYTKLPAASYMSPTRRGARLGEAQTRRTARRDAANLDKSYLTAFNRLSKDEKDALVYISQGFNTVERAKTLIAARTKRIAEKNAEHPGKLLPDTSGSKRARSGADAADLVTDIRVIRRALPHIQNPSTKLLDALEAQRAVNAVTQATFIRNLMREGKTLEAAQEIVRDRAQMPLLTVGIKPLDNETLTILSHVIKKSDKERGASLERGLTTKILDEERATTAENWLNARYERDASLVLQTHRLMFAKEQTFMRMERALANADAYDAKKHAAGLASGELHWIKKNDAILNDMDYVDSSLHRVEKQIGDFTDAEFESLRDAYTAMHDLIQKDGSPGMVMSKAHYDELVGQFKTGRGILEKITDGVGALTKPWRHIVLSLKGSFYVNNFIGNLLLGIVAYGPRYILDTAKESLPAFMRDGVSKQISSGVADLERTAGARNVADMSKAARIDVFSRVGEKVAAQGVKLTEDNFRRGAFRANLRTRAKEYRAANPGMTHHQAIESLLNDKQAVDQLAEMTYGDLLDYSKLTPIEKELLLPAMPFWNFTRAMTGRTIRLTLDEPWKMRVLLLFGNVGIEANIDALPEGLDLPEYLKGMILGDPTGETQRVISTYGMNPFVAPVDLVAQLMSLGGGGEGSPNPLASFNPLWKVPLEAVIEKDLFTGQDVRSPSGDYPDSIGGRAWVQAQKNIPQWAMLQRYRYPSKYPAIERDASDTAMQYLGFPVGDLRADNIAQVNAISAAYEAREKAFKEKQKAEIAERARF